MLSCLFQKSVQIAMKNETEKCTRESHALDAVALAFEILTETRMLSRFASTVEAFNDYE